MTELFNLEAELTAVTHTTLRLLEPFEQKLFELRVRQYWGDVQRPLRALYGTHPQYTQWLRHYLKLIATAYANRPKALHQLDLQRMSQPDWFQQSNMIGYVCYTERFADNLPDIQNKIPYLKELGVRYLHLMPLLEPRDGPNDGGYAVRNYRQVRSDLGTMDDLAELTAVLRQHNISVCIDMVCNHTAKDHAWARQAMAGDPKYQDYYLMFPDRTLPDQYEQTLPEVFPDLAPGNFTYYPEMEQWVWTTFNEYQWDLNYSNPAVLGDMLDNILFLANQGIEVLRLDAVAFMWKRLGTDSQNQPEAHYILQAFRALSRIVAPALILKAEAIVSPDKLIPYLGRGIATHKECELAYHNVFMVTLWSALAERKAVLMTHILQNMPPIPHTASWITYIRCHDDIGWAITEEDAAGVGLNGFEHRAFLSDFYSNRFSTTFARGTTFQFNPKTQDRRINGSLASLAGLEQAIAQNNLYAIELSIRRILLLHAMIFSFGGLPLIYMGDELGLLNDESYLQDPHLANDSRWIHRPYMDWQKAQERQDPHTITGRIFLGLQHLIHVRQHTPTLHAETANYPIWTHNDHVFGMVRQSPRGRILILANMTEQEQVIPDYRLPELGFESPMREHIGQTVYYDIQHMRLAPYQVMWLEKQVPLNIEPHQALWLGDEFP